MTTPPASVKNPLALWDGSWDLRERPNIRKFVHYEMAMHRQASAVLVVCQIKKLLKELGIKDTDKEVKARVVVWYQSEQSDLLFSQTWQVKLIGGGKPCKALQIEFFKPCGKGYLDTL